MKKSIVLAAILASVSVTAMAGSYQFGTVTEFVAEKDRFTFQLDTSADNIDIRAENCNGNPLNFSVDANLPGAKFMFELVQDAKANNTKIGVNGDGQCWAGGEFENADSIAPEH